MASQPETISNVVSSQDGRQFAPSTARNKDPILALVRSRLGEAGRFLEIASGTGEHIVHFAHHMPGWRFQPTEADPARLSSIQAWIAHSKAQNIATPELLDAANPGWGQTIEVDAISMCNLFHLISTEQTKAILKECAKALAPRGLLIIYGPFKRDGELTSDGDARFHASITSQNPTLGYKNDFDMFDWIEGYGLTLSEVIEMPANNLAIIACREN